MGKKGVLYSKVYRWMATIVFAIICCITMSGPSYADEIRFEDAPDDVAWDGTLQDEETGIEINSSNFPQLYKTLRGFAYDTDQDGFLSSEEIDKLELLAVSGGISDLKGVEHLTSLRKLFLCKFNGSTLRLGQSAKQIDTLCVMPTQKTFTIDAPYIKNLAVGQVRCEDNSIKGHVLINASYNTDAHVNNATRKVVLTNCTQVKNVVVRMGWMNSLVLPKAGNCLNRLTVNGAMIRSLNLENASKLEVLEVMICEQLKELDLNRNRKLKTLTIESLNSLASVKISNCTDLLYASIYWDVGVKKIDFSKCKKIKKVFRPNEAVSVVMPAGKASALTGYGFDSKDQKDFSDYQSYRLGTLISNGYVERHDIEEVSYNQDRVVKLDKKNFPDIYSQISYLDFDKNGWLTQSELDWMKYLSCDTKIRTLKGIEHFRFLTELRLTDYAGEKITISQRNNRLRTIDVTCSAKKLTVNADKLHSLKITMSNDEATKVDVAACKNLSAFSLETRQSNSSNVKLQTVVMPKCGGKLKYLELNSLGINHVNVSCYPNLEGIGLFYNRKLKSISLDKNTKLRAFWTISGYMGTIDLSKCTKLEEYLVPYDKTILPKKNLPKRKTNYRMYGIYYSIDGYQI